MLYNKYRRQWLVFVVVVGGRRRYRTVGLVLMKTLSKNVGWKVR